MAIVAGQLLYRIDIEGGRSLLVRNADSGTVAAAGAQVGVAWSAADVILLHD